MNLNQRTGTIVDGIGTALGMLSNIGQPVTAGNVISGMT